MAASIILAALVGGVIFVLLDSWQRREATPTTVEPERTWMPAARTAPLPRTPAAPRWDADDRWPPRRDDDDPPPNLWSGWANRQR